MKLVEYRRNHYMTHNKQLLSFFTDFLKILGQLNMFHGLALEIKEYSEAFLWA